jgi:hypothetical protein
MRVLTITLAALLVAASVSSAASIKISLGIRETNNNPATTAIFSNAGASNGIEWVNLDGQTLVADGTWQLFTFTPATDTLTAFAGATADGMLTAGMEFASLEHIRILNSDGITAPIRLWVDDVTNTVAAGPVVEGFEGFAVGTEVMFQEPNFSGSTSANILLGGTSLVSSSMAFGGSQSNEVRFQFVDNTPTRWVRLTTFNTPNLPNPAIRVTQPGAPAPTVSFYAKAVVIPEPCSAVLLGLAGLGLLALRRQMV